MQVMDDIFLYGDSKDDMGFYPLLDAPCLDPLQDYVSQIFPMGSMDPDSSPSEFKTTVRSNEEENCLEEHFEDETISTKPQQKSPFHNFQKHLIAFVKRTTKINYRLESNVVCALWRAFNNTHSVNKRVLHTVFGVRNSGEEMCKLGEQFKEFSAIFNNYTEDELLSAQETLRNLAVSAAEKLDKKAFMQNCNVRRAEEFYLYYISFIAEIKEGPLDRRMTKVRKNKVMKKLRQTKFNQ